MSLINFVLGPKLIREYANGGQGSKLYEPTMFLEVWGEKLLGFLSVAYNIGFYTSPFIGTFLYRRGFFVAESISSVVKFITGIGMIYVISVFMRGVGRSQSPVYTRFIRALELSKSSADSKRLLSLFDFDFKYWKVDYDVKAMEDSKKHKTLDMNSSIWNIFKSPCDLIACLAIHSFGIRMIYPGSIKLLQSYLSGPLNDGRAQLIEQQRAERNKIRTRDNNDIDTIFIDNRSSKEAKKFDSKNGKILVICSEGNSGFYEIGIISTPLSLKYSVLGWNHPGFGGSTGAPYPSQEQNAIDAVMQFAINKLGFPVENIILFGWSIGGYNSIWAATQYPDIKGLVLDATFDDLLYLALPQMPQGLSGIVKIAIRDYCNLHNEELIKQYKGPVTLIRRVHDEIIASDQRIETNRGNFLLLNLLKSRFPNIFQQRQIGFGKMLLSKPLESASPQLEIDNLLKIESYVSEYGSSYPLAIGHNYTDEELFEMTEFLIRWHLKDFKSDHCSPLPGEYFTVPWNISS